MPNVTPRELLGIGVAVAVIAVAALLLRVVRHNLGSRRTGTAVAVAIGLVILALQLGAGFAGLRYLATIQAVVLIGAFTGFLAMQRQPWATHSLLRALAFVAGAATLSAAATANLLVVVLGAVATGGLLYLGESSGARSR